MKTCYVDWHAHGIVDLIAPGELFPHWVITRINVPRQHRGRGVARALLTEVLADADREQVTLALEVSPSDGLDEEALRAWYGRHGFVTVRWGYMRRRPVRPEATTHPMVNLARSEP